VICNGQFLTPEQLREQYDLGYGARTHYEMSGSRRTDMFNRVNPDYLLRGTIFVLFLRTKNKRFVWYLGFFPFWSIVMIVFALIFLVIAVVGLIGYFLGCRRPTLEELRAKEFQQVTPDDEFLLGHGGAVGITDLDDRRPSPHADRARIGQSHEDMV